jgi:hypothetical protein
VGGQNKYGRVPAHFLQQEETVMCDYSLHHVANRPAQIEDKLVTAQFGNSITRGFAAVGEPCGLPAARH